VQTPVDFTKPTPQVAEFFDSVHRAYYREIIGHLRSVGVRVPVAGTNWTHNAFLLAGQLETDFSDSHVYWYDWCWKPEEKRFNNRTMLEKLDGYFGFLGFFRLEGKPFFVSEWDDPWPNEWRAESVLQMAAVTAFQGWQGVAIHTYRYTTREGVDCIGQPITSDAIGGVAYRGGVFDTFNDPAKFGLFYHAALIVRRQDVARAAKKLIVDVSAMHRNGTPIGSENTAAVEGAFETHEMAMRVKGSEGAAGHVVDPATRTVAKDATKLESDTGELRRDLQKRIASIDSPRTKVAYGFLGAAGPVELDGMRVTMRTDFGVVALSSLTDKPIRDSDNLLLTTVGRADNTGSRYNEEHTLQLELGHGPVQVEVIEADLEFESTVEHMRIWAINPDGFPIGHIPVERKDGVLKFSVGNLYPSMYYLIQRV
jgi:hypothetical protein